MIKKGDLNIRRIDARNFILEVARIAGDKSETPGEVVWEFEGFYNSIQGLCKAALSKGCKGESAAELVKSVSEAEARIMDALSRIETPAPAVPRNQLVDQAEKASEIVAAQPATMGGLF